MTAGINAWLMESWTYYYRPSVYVYHACMKFTLSFMSNTLPVLKFVDIEIKYESWYI